MDPGEGQEALDRALFFVGTRPKGVWCPEMRAKDLAMLRAFDCNHFGYLARVHSAQLETEERQRAAVAIRFSVGMAGETLLALIGAMLQAPYCVFGWLHEYRARPDLELVAKACLGRAQLATVWKFELTCEAIAAEIHRAMDVKDQAKKDEITAHFATFVRSTIHDFMDRLEYNSIKHGLRIEPGGFSLAVGRKETFGVEPAEMQSLGGSDYGGSFLVLDPVSPAHKCDYFVRELSTNWDPTAMLTRLRIASMVINNIVSYLRLLRGKDTEVKFRAPKDLSDFDVAFRGLSVPTKWTTSTRLKDPSEIPQTTEGLVRSFYPVDPSSEPHDAGG